MVTPSDPRLEFLLQVQSDQRAYGAISPQTLRNPPVARSVINDVWCGADPFDVLGRLDKAEAEAGFHRIWVDRVAARLDVMAEQSAEAGWKPLKRASVDAHHLIYKATQTAARLALRARAANTGLALVARYKVARATATEKLFSAYGRALIAKLPVPYETFRALDSRVYAGGNGASEGLVHVFPRAEIFLPDGGYYSAGESLGKKKWFWSLVADDGTTPIALTDLKVAEKILSRLGIA